MASTAESYRLAALENIARARLCFELESYFLAHYLSGLAVECYLRALIRLKTPKFDSRHDIGELAKEALFYDRVRSSESEKFSAIFGEINSRWRSNHRYFSERQFLDYMNEIRAEYNMKGSRWKNMSRKMLENAFAIINKGEAQWPNA